MSDAHHILIRKLKEHSRLGRDDIKITRYRTGIIVHVPATVGQDALPGGGVGGNLRATALVERICQPDADDTNERQGQAAEPEDAEILKNYTDRELSTDGGDANTDPDQNGSEDHDK